MPARIVSFFSPTFVVVVAFGFIAGIANVVMVRNHQEPDFDSSGSTSDADLGDIDLSRVVLPQPSLQPEEVVKLQLAGLADEQADGVGILQCYCFASPGNRIVTGPLERFGRMVRQAPYQSMAHPRAVLVGRPERRERLARLLVTVVDGSSQIQAFTFFLSQQQDPPFTDCWMTEAVIPAITPAKNESPPPAA